MLKRPRRRLTEAERDARRQADRARMEQAARALLTSEGWQRWIRVRATNGLARYSLRNQWLIACECHARGITPTYAAGFHAFLGLNRCVRKGEAAIRILAPVAVKERDEEGQETGEKRVFFRTVPVFDVSQTDPLPGVEPVPLTPPAEPIEGDSHAHLIPFLRGLAREIGYRVEVRELPEPGPGGWCDPDRRQIVVGGESIPYVAGWGEDGALDAIRQYAQTIDTIARRIEDALAEPSAASQAAPAQHAA
jgi:antirestriction factor ArdC-like protein